MDILKEVGVSNKRRRAISEFSQAAETDCGELC